MPRPAVRSALAVATEYAAAVATRDDERMHARRSERGVADWVPLGLLWSPAESPADRPQWGMPAPPSDA